MAELSARPSAYDHADPAFLRLMLDIGGRLLSEIASETDSVAILQDLCGSMQDFLDAVEVRLVISGEAAEFGARWSVIADETGVGPIEPAPGADHRPQPHPGSGHHHVDIVASSGDPLAVLSVKWPGGSANRPTELDRLVCSRFGYMAFVIIERHLARRRQLQAIAREREAIAGDIHDDPIQTMTAVSLRLQRMANKVSAGEARNEVEEIRALADDAIERLRHVMYSLYPETLDEDGLVAALDAYCETYLDVEGLQWVVEDHLGQEPPGDLGMLAFRLARNAVVNAVNHAAASKLVIAVSTTEQRLQLTVTDDGVGFDVAALGHTEVGHFGIPHSRTLAHWAGGSYTVTSSPGHGTRVDIDLPIS
ncbi:MAG: sensor histidine kinase [Acidimicrobiales bacterium]